ncbi:SDR family oxidoreductase [Parahaliea aestuarii]|uniref:SDR family oxidoreductase n=1 Tax=Parahaliea aestuarii TaxID=1852021 RepID=A0A5C8ZW12_9GAMM|nr:SDR family oxidoreductase [Parahaliea aestuarii]TXS91750.1 SDR family oxidoreductase [Parahaliea aestuarii]
MTDNLQGQHIVVTGGGSGFGLAIARELVGNGARVTLLGRRQAALDDAVAALGTDCAAGVVCDVADPDAIRRGFADLSGPIDGLVNNAGMARPGAVDDLDESEVIQQVNTNFLGTVFCCKAAIPLLRGRPNARIVNISSASAWHYDEMSHLSIYASTKAAVERFTRDLRQEVQRDGIGVTCVRPGAAWTNFADGWDAERIHRGFEAWMKTGPDMDSGMLPEHVAQAVAHVFSYPRGVAVDLLEVRPNQPIPKPEL